MPLNLEMDVSLYDVIFGQFLQFACFGWAVFIIMRIVNRKTRINFPAGMWILVFWLITTSVSDLPSFVNYHYMRQQFAPMSEELFRLRFAFSILLRLALIAIGFGLIRLKEWARQGAVYFGVFTIATIYWKHPYYVFQNIAIMVEQNQSPVPVTQLQYPAFPWICMFVYTSIDLIFAGLLIYYFTQASVAGLYHHDRKAQ